MTLTVGRDARQRTRAEDAVDPKSLGRCLRAVRRRQGLSRADAARSAGLTRRELAAYERGRARVPDGELSSIAGSCGVDVRELLPDVDPLGARPAAGWLLSARPAGCDGSASGALRRSLALVYELRDAVPGEQPPLTEEARASLAAALGGSPAAIEQRLVELMGAPREEAARLRALILTGSSPGPPPEHLTDPYAALRHLDTSDELADLGAFARADDQFASPPLPGRPADVAPISWAAPGLGASRGADPAPV